MIIKDKRLTTIEEINEFERELYGLKYCGYENIHRFTDEAADVLIMLSQIIEGTCTQKRVKERIDYKLNRQISRIEEEKNGWKITDNKPMLHEAICENLNTIYMQKNNDYGDSFAEMRKEYPNAILIRIHDKYARLKRLMSGIEQQVNDESIEDTLMDLANYCIMELVERERDKHSTDE